jgi:hypothetical protein
MNLPNINNKKPIKMRKRFTKQEDRAILDAYVKHGFHLTAQAMEEASMVTGRTPDAIRNRLSRYLFPQYPMTLNRDVHIRIFLMTEFARAHNSNNYQEVLLRTAKMFKLNPSKFIKDFENDNNDIWGKTALRKTYDRIPNTIEQFVTQYIAKEDEKFHLYDDLVMKFLTEKKEPKMNWFRRYINWFKNLFK